MKSTTKYWIGIHHIGLAAEEPKIEFLDSKSLVLLIARFVAETQLATRIEIKIGRSKEEVENRIGKTDFSAEFAEELENLFANETSDD
jgi:hypothetical protein